MSYEYFLVKGKKPYGEWIPPLPPGPYRVKIVFYEETYENIGLEVFVILVQAIGQLDTNYD